MRQNATVDVDTILKAAGVIGASAAVATIVDVGDATMRGEIIIDVSAIEIASNDEIYDIVLQGSPDADFGTPGDIHDIASISLGAKEVKRTDSDKDDVAGRYVLPFTNFQYGTKFRYLRLYTAVAGSIDSGGGISYTANMHKRA